MSKLDNIILECVNKALDSNEEKLGDYVDPTKEQVKALMLELIGDNWNHSDLTGWEKEDFVANQVLQGMREKVNQL